MLHSIFIPSCHRYARHPSSAFGARRILKSLSRIERVVERSKDRVSKIRNKFINFN